MSRIEEFMKKVSSVYHLSEPVLYHLWNSIECPKCGKSCTCEKQKCHCGKAIIKDIYCKEHIPLCQILMQGGPRKHEVCLQIALQDGCCVVHQGVRMCKQEDCKSTTKSELCIYHEREKIYQEKQSIPTAMIRKRDNYYLIQGTNLIIDPSYRALIGYIEEDRIYYRKNEKVEQACLYYHLSFRDTVDTTELDTVELNQHP